MTDTIPETTATTYTLTPGQTYTSTIDPADVSGATPDKDWYKVALTAGHSYTFSAVGTSGTLNDVAIDLKDASGNIVNSQGVVDGGAGGTASFPYTASASGTYYLAISAGGSNYLNLTGNYQITVTDNSAAAQPNLTASSLDVSNPTVADGGQLSFSYNVSNTGAGSATASYAGVYLSTDSTITTSDTLLEARSTPSLTPGQFSPDNVVYDVPSNLAPGTYYLGVVADYPNQIPESNESDNASNAVQITVTAAAVPDLTISSWNPSSTTGTAGSNLTINYTLANVGSGAAGASTAGVYLSSDSTITTSDTLLGTQADSSLTGNSSASHSTTITLPTTPGTYYLGVIADINNAVAEGSETNNASSAYQITVTPSTVTPPNLQAASLVVNNPTVADGGQLSFSYNVNNTGAGSATASYAGVYLSTDSTITTSDTLLEARSTPSLTSGQSSSDNVVYDVPSTLAPGTYYLGVIADYPNQIPESNESDNASNAVQINVTAAAVPDLTISSWNPSSTTGTAGSNLTINYTLANVGSGAAGASTAGVYLSSDSTITTSDTLLGTQADSSLTGNSSASHSTTVTLPTTPGTYYLGVIADIDNAVPEGSETNNASSAYQITVTPSVGTAPQFTVSNAGPVTEGDDAVFTVTMSGTISAPDTIWYSTYAGTASAANGDYSNSFVDQAITFTPGGPNTQQIVIPTNITQNAHPDTFYVGLQNTQNGGAFATGSATIVAPDGPPSFSISNAGTVTEGDDAVFTVTMSGAISAPDTIWYSTYAGTASATVGDYPNTFVDQAITFTPGGPNTQQIVVPTYVTQNAHPDTFSVGLQSTQNGGAFVSGTATIIAATTAPPMPTTAPATSDLPTAALATSAQLVYNTLLQQSSPNLTSYLATDNSITTQELVVINSNYKTQLSSANDFLSKADDIVGSTSTVLGGVQGIYDVISKTIKTVDDLDPVDALMSGVSVILDTPYVKSKISSDLDQGLQFGLAGAGVFTACVALAAASAPADIAVAGVIATVAAADFALKSLNLATEAATLADPPDPNYQQVFVPTQTATVPAPATGLPTDLATAGQSAITDVDQATQWMEAVDITENRYATALAAGDANSASMQYAAFLNYMGLYMSAAQAAQTDLPNLASQLQSYNIGTQTLTAQQLATALGSAQTQASSTDMSALLRSLGFTDSEIQTMVQQVTAETAPTSQASQTADYALTNLASGFSSVVPGPTLTIASAGGLTNQAIQTISGTIDTADSGQTVSIFDGATLLGTATPGGDGNWSAGVTLSGDGAHNLIAKATDSAGDLGTSSAVAYTLDTKAPDAPAITGGDVNDGILSLSGTAEAGATITVYDGSSQLAGTATADGSGSWTFATGEDASVVRSFTAVATDAADNSSVVSATLIQGTLGNDVLVGGAGDDVLVGDPTTTSAVAGDITAGTPSTILQFSGSGFDATQVSDPTVAATGNGYTLLYAGLPFGNNMQIGLATSSDGSTWTKSSSSPVISNANSPSWASFREIPVTLMYENGAYELWFNGDNSNLSTDSGYGTGFGYATSPDGVNWTIAANPIRWELNNPNGTVINLDEVVKFNSQYIAYYQNNTPSGFVVDYATSTDGQTFANDTAVGGLPSGDNILAATTATTDGVNEVFAVVQDASGGDHYATSTDGTTFNVQGTLSVPSGFAPQDIIISNGQIEIFGGDGVGNVNWSYGNTNTEVVTAPLSSLGAQGGNDTLFGGGGQDTLTGGPGSDTFGFDAASLSSAQTATPVYDTITDYDQGNTGAFTAAEGDQIDLSALLSGAYAQGTGQQASSLVRAIEDAGGKFALLQIDPDGSANGANWITIAQLNGVQSSDSVSVVLDPTQPAVTVPVFEANPPLPAIAPGR